MNQFNNRHPSVGERKVIAALLEEVGPAEVLRVIGQWVSVTHDDATIGNNLRTVINRVARDVSEV